jgi:hypothetical protein
MNIFCWCFSIIGKTKNSIFIFLDYLFSQKERSVFRRYIGVGKKVLILKGE